MKTKLILAALLTTLTLAACAQDEIVINKQGEGIGMEKPILISVNGFAGEAAQVLNFDLTVQGFKVVPDGAAQYDVTGSDAGGVQGRLSDRLSKAVLFSKAYNGGSARAQAHALADDIVTAIRHLPPIGRTKIAFKVTEGGSSEIYIADFDGHNARAVTADHSTVAAPAWVPGRLGLYYVSYKLGNADIFSHNLSTGTRAAFARYGGSNMSPAVSPDGSRVAMILSKDGWVDLYVCNSDGTGLKRLTKSPQDESSPCWSPDGKWILYAGKIGEHRALYKISPEGGDPIRVRTDGVLSPSEPDWSPDGKWIAFTAQMGGFQICVVPATGGSAITLVEGEDPSWAPNSRTVVFAHRTGHGRALSVLDVFTKQVKDVQQVSGSNSQPGWAR
jgi:TolB protein